jgi:hypothetical protein
MPVILATWVAETGRSMVQSQPTKIVFETPISKNITKAKWTGGGVQAVECLLCKCEALSLNSSPTKKTNKQTNKKST